MVLLYLVLDHGTRLVFFLKRQTPGKKQELEEKNDLLEKIDVGWFVLFSLSLVCATYGISKQKAETYQISKQWTIELHFADFLSLYWSFIVVAKKHRNLYLRLGKYFKRRRKTNLLAS